MISVHKTDLKARIAAIDSLPTIPTIIRPLLDLLGTSQEIVEVEKVVESISYDKTIVAQILRVANSALFSPSRHIESVRGGVINLGLHRVKEIVFACTFCQTIRFKEVSLDPVIFWRHSFGTALVSRKLSRLIDFPNPEQAYLAGLLHDIGFQVNSLIDPEAWKTTVHLAMSTLVPLFDAEMSVLGYSHCQTGRILAEQWHLPTAIADVIEFHHDMENTSQSRNLVAIVHLSDLLCRMRDMGYGYYELLRVDFTGDPAWPLLAGQFRKLVSMDLALFTFELDAIMEKVRQMVEEIFSMQTVTQ